jgi:hypothetical protein
VARPGVAAPNERLQLVHPVAALRVCLCKYAHRDLNPDLLDSKSVVDFYVQTLNPVTQYVSQQNVHENAYISRLFRLRLGPKVNFTDST